MRGLVRLINIRLKLYNDLLNRIIIICNCVLLFFFLCKLSIENHII